MPSSSKLRNQDTATLLDYGFNNYKNITLYKANDIISSSDFNNAKSANNDIITKEDINIVVKKNIAIDNLIIEINLVDIDAPKKQDDVIGTIKIKDSQNNILATYDLYPKNNIEKLSFWDLILKYMRQII